MLSWLLLFLALALTVGLAWWKVRSHRGSHSSDRLHPIGLQLAPKERHLLLLMIDGLPIDPFEDALTSGSMPNLKRLLDERATLRMQAISTFPSATAPSLPELLAGRYVELENLGAPGAVHAFDRERRRIVRYITEPTIWDWPVPNLFDTVHRAGLPAVTVFEGSWEGSESILTTAAVARAAAREVIGGSNGVSGDRGPVQTLLERIRRKGIPRVTLVVFNDVDMKGHFHGPDSASVKEALANIDELIGEIRDAFARERTERGTRVLDETTVILFGDHGMVRSGSFLDLVAFFKSRGLSAYDASTLGHVLLRERLGSLWTRWPDALVVSGGSNIAQIYLRSPGGGWTDEEEVLGWESDNHRRPDIESLARNLADLPGVGQVIWPRSRHEVVVRGQGGRRASIIQDRKGRGIAYVVPDRAESDPFGYLEDPLVAPLIGRGSRAEVPSFHPAERWMKATLGTRYPAAVALIPKAFHPRRFTGDLMVTALPGWSFMRSQHGDHGNLERDAIMTPLVLNGPGIEGAHTSEIPRLVDIFPTAAVLLGADADDPVLRQLDGTPVPGVRGP